MNQTPHHGEEFGSLEEYLKGRFQISLLFNIAFENR